MKKHEFGIFASMTDEKENCGGITPEIHLFVIWNKARNREKEIIEELNDNFEILEIYEIEWDKKNFKHNLERFYCEKIRKKICHTGTGKFLTVLVKDVCPQYNYEETLKGFEFVNAKVLKIKQALRNRLGGGYKVHSTSDLAEANKNLHFLLGKSYKEYYEFAINKHFDGKYITLKQEPAGTYGFKNIQEVFKLLNCSCRYVVLRNTDEKGGDIDLLVENFSAVKYLLNAEKVYKNPCRCQVKTKIAGETKLFDIRSTGDDYYCMKWEEDILKNRVFDDGGFYVPCRTDLFYTLIYHVLFHKKDIPHKYDDILKELLPLDTDTKNHKDSYDLYYKMLALYMREKDYYPSVPKDKKVKLNRKNVRKMMWIELLSQKYNFDNINTFILEKEPVSRFEFFFTADYGSEKVFIKCGSGSYDAKKEFEVYGYLNKQNQEYFPRAITYRNLANDGMFLCIEYIKGDILSDELIKNSSVSKQNKMFDSLYNIALILYKNKFIHRDINFSNLIAGNDGTIKLIDFQHLTGKNFKENPENIEYPKNLRGTNKKLRPFPFVWDDMFSIYNILTKFNGLPITDYDKKISDIKSKIGWQRYFFFDNKFPLKAYLNFKLLFVYKTVNTLIKPLRKFIK